MSRSLLVKAETSDLNPGTKWQTQIVPNAVSLDSIDIEALEPVVKESLSDKDFVVSSTKFIDKLLYQQETSDW